MSATARFASSSSGCGSRPPTITSMFSGVSAVIVGANIDTATVPTIGSSVCWAKRTMMSEAIE
ncbi:MAG: hypothetical protein U5L06_12030 [Rhodovibrio sp.]|nr:hypothetical protein [Rhodovibrio sp.]